MMKKIRVIAVSKRNLAHFCNAVFISLCIFSVNLFYFFDVDSAIKASASLFDYDIDFVADEGRGGKLAIIIDDFGQNRDGVKEMFSIERHLTFAVMPFLTFSRSDAVRAHELGYEVIVHLPMESNFGKLSWVGPRPILTVMKDREIQELVKESFESVPYAAGANIHMGAKAGDSERVMADVLEVIGEKGLYFVDSRSSKHPVAKKLADSMGVLCYDRNVFLDGKKSKTYIKSRLKRAAEIAVEKGAAVAIGHVGTEGGKVTAQAITEMLPYFDEKNIRLVFISELKE